LSLVTTLQGVGPSVAERLANLHITTVQDLLFHLPLRYQDRTCVYSIGAMKPGDQVLIEGEIVGAQITYGKRRQLLCRFADSSGEVRLRFFHFSARQQQQLSQIGLRLRCFGEIREGYRQGIEMVHPEYRLIQQSAELPLEDRLTPIYRATKGLQQKTLRQLTTQALKLMDADEGLQEFLPQDLLNVNDGASLKSALCYVHRPPADASTALLQRGEHPMQQRLAFEELIAHHLGLHRLRLQMRSHPARSLSLPSGGSLQAQLLESLPFRLTSAQQRVLAEINVDMAKAFPMLRLVQGDVGSGKTIVSALAMLSAVEQGYQSALMVPTEILAEQHAQSLQRWFSPLGISVGLLLGHHTGQVRSQNIQKTGSGEYQVLVGTHALFQSEVTFSSLALLVIDEQHRFGVEQRLALKEKGIKEGLYPHQLIMTATPIPRTLAMTAYADLDMSVIDELPPGRQPITTVLVSNQRRDRVIERVRVNCKAGRQAYWVCTLIDDSETLRAQAAAVICESLQQSLPELSIGLVHGRLKQPEKEKMMSLFKSGQLDLLVATTVIEVGVDVVNASLMIIENPERLGLAQLHQLRGRIGRGQEKSFCVLLYQSPLSKTASQRLAVMRKTQDGFQISEEDLKMRGPGEVLGTRQTGLLRLRVADLIRDKAMLPRVQEASKLLVEKHPSTVDLLMRRWLHGIEAYVAV